MRLAIVFCALLAGCTHTQVDVNSRTSQSSVLVHVEGGRSLAALVGLSLLAAGIYEAEFRGPPRLPAPELDPTRRVSEQDCTQPIDYSLGNLRCK